jgi:hypothetical protein
MNDPSNPVEVGKYATDGGDSQGPNDPPQDFQPEQGLHDPDDMPRSRTQNDMDVARVNQNAGDDITESPEEA